MVSRENFNFDQCNRLPESSHSIKKKFILSALVDSDSEEVIPRTPEKTGKKRQRKKRRSSLNTVAHSTCKEPRLTELSLKECNLSRVEEEHDGAEKSSTSYEDSVDESLKISLSTTSDKSELVKQEDNDNITDNIITRKRLLYQSEKHSVVECSEVVINHSFKEVMALERCDVPSNKKLLDSPVFPTTDEFVCFSQLDNAFSQEIKKEDAFADSFSAYDIPLTQVEKSSLKEKFREDPLTMLTDIDESDLGFSHIEVKNSEDRLTNFNSTLALHCRVSSCNTTNHFFSKVEIASAQSNLDLGIKKRKSLNLNKLRKKNVNTDTANDVSFGNNMESPLSSCSQLFKFEDSDSATQEDLSLSLINQSSQFTNDTVSTSKQSGSKSEQCEFVYSGDVDYSDGSDNSNGDKSFVSLSQQMIEHVRKFHDTSNSNSPHSTHDKLEENSADDDHPANTTQISQVSRTSDGIEVFELYENSDEKAVFQPSKFNESFTTSQQNAIFSSESIPPNATISQCMQEFQNSSSLPLSSEANCSESLNVNEQNDSYSKKELCAEINKCEETVVACSSGVGISTSSSKINIAKVLSTTNSENQLEHSQNNRVSLRTVSTTNKENLPTVNIKYSFSTADGKPVGVSKKSLSRVKHLFDDLTETIPSGSQSRQNIIDDHKNSVKVKAEAYVSKSSENNMPLSDSCNSLDYGPQLLDANIENVLSNTHNDLRPSDKFSKILSQEDSDLPSDVLIEKCVGQNYAKPVLNVENNIFQEDLETQIEEELQDISHRSCDIVPFASAAGKPASISKNSSDRVKALFKDITVELPSNDKTASNLLSPPLLPRTGFDTSNIVSMSTGGNSFPDLKKIDPNLINDTLNIHSVSNGGEIGTTKSMDSLELENPASLNSGPNFGFLSAAGKPISIREKNLVRVKNLFSDISDLNFEHSNSDEKRPLSKLESNIEIDQFPKEENFSLSNSTVTLPSLGRQPESVSNDSVEPASNLFDDIQDLKTESPCSKKIKKDTKPKSFDRLSSNVNLAFSSAGGKPVSISEKSLECVKSLFCDISDSTDLVDAEVKIRSEINNANQLEVLNFPKSKDSSLLNPNLAFSSARSSTLSVSKKSMDNAKTLFDDISNKSPTKESVLEVESFHDSVDSKIGVLGNPEASFGFISAGGKPFSVSKKSLDSVKNLFNDISDMSSPSVSQSKIQDFGVASSDCSIKNDPLVLPKSANTSQQPESCSGLNSYNRDKGFPPNESIVKQNAEIETVNGSNKRDISVNPDSTKNETFVTPKTVKCSKLQCKEVENYVKESFADASIRSAFENSFESQIDFSIAHEVSESTAAFLTDDVSFTDVSWSISADGKTVTPKLISSRSSTAKGRGQSLAGSTAEVANNKQCRKRLLLSDAPTCATKTFLPSPANSFPSSLQEKLNIFRIEAAAVQKFLLMNKKNVKEDGVLFLTKKVQTLEAALKPLSPGQFLMEELLQRGVQPQVTRLTSSNSKEFKISILNSDFSDLTSVTVDGGVFVPNEIGCLGCEELEKGFPTLPGVDSSLIPNGWIANHFRWIVWKLASTEKSFPLYFANRALTLSNIVRQLKYRYDRELNRAQRPAFRKILEKDEPASRRFICCVSGIRKVDLDKGEHDFELELTDSWYGVWAVIDKEMSILIRKNKVRIGTKLIVCGAELMNCDQGCDPLELPEDIRLKLSTNSCRRTEWHCKLGFTPNRQLFRVSLGSILPAGGHIPQVLASVARVYPLVHMTKDESGKCVYRTARAETIAAMANEKKQINKAEELYQQVSSEIEEKYSNSEKKWQSFSMKDVRSITQPEVLYAILKNAPDPETCQSMMTKQQLDDAMKYQESLQNQMMQEIREKVEKRLQDSVSSQNVCSLLKLRLVDPAAGSNALLTIWRPSDELISLFDEKSTILFHNLVATGSRDKVVQMSSLRTSQYVKCNENPQEDVAKFRRTLTKISAIDKSSFQPLFNEFDTIGFVVLIKPPSPSGVSLVYLSDAGHNFLSITFWTSLSSFGCDDIIKEGALLSVSNAQWRYGSVSWHLPNCYATETTLFSLQPKQPHFASVWTTYKTAISQQDMSDFVEAGKERIMKLLSQKGNNWNDSRSMKRLSSSPSLRAPSGTSTPVGKRIRLMSRYGEAPPVSPIPPTLLSQAKKMSSGFQSPYSAQKPF